MGFLRNLFNKEKSQQTATPQEENSVGKARFKKIKSKDWRSFATDLCSAGITDKNPPPQLCLYLKRLSMAEALAQFRPSASEAFLSEPPDIMEFPDGTGGVCFKVQDGRSIRKFLDVLLEGREYPGKIVVTNGVTAQLPPSDKSYVLKQFGAVQGMDFGSVMMW